MWTQLSRDITDTSAKAALSVDEALASAFFFFSPPQQHKLLDIWMDLFPPHCLFVPPDVAGEEACQGFFFPFCGGDRDEWSSVARRR